MPGALEVHIARRKSNLPDTDDHAPLREKRRELGRTATDEENAAYFKKAKAPEQRPTDAGVQDQIDPDVATPRV